MKEQKAIPGDIGNFTDENSLAHKLLDNIMRAQDKLAFLSQAFAAMAESEPSLDFLDGIAAIHEDMQEDLFKAHSMICDSWKWKEETSETPSKDTQKT